ncbi:hypothetical protein EB169_08415, partial [archaeon]|nr:hypothetical protein [archaeon]
IETDEDFDQDRSMNFLDLDSDNDGILDMIETDSDFDQDGSMNFIDLDSDNDNCLDFIEAGYNDPDDDGMIDLSPISINDYGQVINVIPYLSPIDQNYNGIYDFIELSNPIPKLKPSVDQVFLKFNKPIRISYELIDNTNYDLDFIWQKKTLNSD